MASAYALFSNGIPELPVWLHTTVGLLVFGILVTFLLAPTQSIYPLVNHDKRSWTYERAKRVFKSDAKRLLMEGAARVRPVQIN